MAAADILALLLALGAAIGCINHLFVGLPRSIGVLLGSLLVSAVVLGMDRLTGLALVHAYGDLMEAADLPHIFLDGTLALLLFAGSLHVDARALNRSRWLILALSTVSVVLATVIFGVAIWVAFRLTGLPVPLGWCCVIGAILAPTDAVVVDSLLRRAPLPARLRVAITGESLFNDGTALVLYLAILGIMHGQTDVIGHGRFLAALALAIAGGAMIGWLGGGAASWIIRRLHDDGLQLLVSLALVLGCYRIAELAQVSAPIAVVTAGVCIKLLTPEFTAGEGRYATLLGFWRLLDELLDTILFLLIGLQVLTLTLGARLLPPVVLAMPLALVARLVSVAVPVGLSRGRVGEKLRDTAVLGWAGLRGGISVALALSLPPTQYRPALLGVCYAVVLFTIIVQGLTMTRVLRGLYGGAADPQA